MLDIICCGQMLRVNYKDYKGKDLLAADYAKVYHNLGTAYARMFMYDKAVIYYDEAYRTGQHEESKYAV